MRNPNSKMVYGVCGSYFHIYADILLNLFTAPRKFNFRNRYVSSSVECGWRIVETKQSDSDFEG